ncbi:MAG: glycosyltransferase family 9 protein [Acidobacteriota bacterium]
MRLSSLGDILHTLPAYQSLRRAFPHSEIGWLVEKRTSFLLSVVSGIDSLHVIDTRGPRETPWAPWQWLPILRTMRELRRRKYDLAIDFQGLLKTALLSRLSGAPRRIGFGASLVRERPAHWFYNRVLGKGEPPGHVVDLNLSLAGLAGVAPAAERIRFQPGAPDVEAVTSLLRKAQLSEYAVINPGGGWKTKIWKTEKYGAVVRALHDRLQLPVVITTGPGEEWMFERIACHCGPANPVHAHVPFLQLIPLYARARLVIAGDTGPLHLACALGTPVVGLYGPSSPHRNGPWHTRSEVVYRELPCSFCYGRTCPTQNECMDLEIAEVLEAVCRCLGKAG